MHAFHRVEDVDLRGGWVPLGRAAAVACFSRPAKAATTLKPDAFLDDLKRHLRHQKAILVWDGLRAHKSRVMQEYLLRQRGWLTVERLPGCAPDLHPIETMGEHPGEGTGQPLRPGPHRTGHDAWWRQAPRQTVAHSAVFLLQHAGLSF
jgi:hypothetical protein